MLPPWPVEFLRKTEGLRSDFAPCGMPVTCSLKTPTKPRPPCIGTRPRESHGRARVARRKSPRDYELNYYVFPSFHVFFDQSPCSIAPAPHRYGVDAPVVRAARAVTLRAFSPGGFVWLCGFLGLRSASAQAVTLRAFGPGRIVWLCGFLGLRSASAQAVTLRAFGPGGFVWPCGFLGLRCASAQALTGRAFSPAVCQGPRPEML